MTTRYVHTQFLFTGILPVVGPQNMVNFFIHRTYARIKSGHSSGEAVTYFEDLRGTKSLSQCHKTLQLKKRKRATDDDDELQN
jgi:hypothetical protein